MSEDVKKEEPAQQQQQQEPPAKPSVQDQYAKFISQQQKDRNFSSSGSRG